MGRIKTKQIKRVTIDLVDKHGEEFSREFSENQGHVTRFANIKSKKLRNTIAGYVTRLIKSNKD